MSLINLSVRGVPILDMSREKIFYECRKGLGSLILPHFSQSERIPKNDLDIFPHVPYLRRLGVRDPFQHGVSRYVSWRYQAAADSVTGSFAGRDVFHGYRIEELCGFYFSADVRYRIADSGIVIDIEVKGEEPVEAGIHFYYDLKNRNSAWVELPLQERDKPEVFCFNQGHNQTYWPSMTNEWVTYTLTTESYVLQTMVRATGNPEETFNAVTLFNPEGARFACVEPLSFSQRGENEFKRIRGSVILRAVPDMGAALTVR